MENLSVVSVSIQTIAPILIKTINCGRTAEIIVSGHSMDPLMIDRLSRVILGSPDRVKRGDIVFYRRDNGTYVLHRIVRAAHDGTYVLCGDAQTALEYGICRDQIFAKVKSFARRDSWVSCDSFLYNIWWRQRLFFRPLRDLCKRGTAFIKRRLKRCFEKISAGRRL